MTLLRGREIDTFLAKPDPRRPVVLLFGTDPGAVSERAGELSAKLSGGDPLAVSRFDEAEIAAEPDRLANEVYAGSLFGGSRVIRVKIGGQRSIASALSAILKDPPAGAWLILEAGDLRKTSAIRRACENAEAAAAIGCYPDNDASLGRLIDADTAAADVSIEPEARTMLIGLLGADRAASRSEIQKLCLYAGPGGRITVDAVATTVGDGAAFAIGDVIEAAATGDQAALERGFRRLLAAGTSVSSIGTLAERHFMQLHALRAAIEAGQPTSSVLQSIRPPLFPSRRAAMERQLKIWRLTDLNDALTRLNRAMIDSRLNAGVATAAISRALVGIAARAGQLSSRRAA